MSSRKRLKKINPDDREWSNKVLREVIFPEIYERYGPNAEPNMQLPPKDLEDLRREVYVEEQPEGVKPSGSNTIKVPQLQVEGTSSNRNHSRMQFLAPQKATINNTRQLPKIYGKHKY
jgi:hypothetical protein